MLGIYKRLKTKAKLMIALTPKDSRAKKTKHISWD